MSQIKLKHSGGNGVIIAAPSSNPAADRTLTLPGDADSTIDILARSSNILQVVGNSNGTAFTSTSTSFADSGITQNITLSAANSKVFFICNISVDTARDNQNTSGRVRLSRSGATADSDRTYGGNDKNVGGYVGGANTHNRFMAQFTMTGLDTELGNNAAGTTLTYKLQVRCENSGSNADFRVNSNNEISFITLVEVAA